MTLTISLLGYPTLSVAGEPLDIPRRKALALFIYLVATRRPHTRDHLCTLFWTNYDAGSARAELRRMLSTLNQTPLAAYIEANRQTVRVVEQDTLVVDLWQLEQRLANGEWQVLAEGIKRWVMPFLEGFSLVDAPQFEEWQMLTTQQIQQRLIPVFEQGVIQAQARQDYAGALSFLQIWLTLDPDNESLHRWLMLSYAQTGQALAALDHYEQLAHRFHVDFDSELEYQTRQLAEQIRYGLPIEQHVFAGGQLPPLPEMLIGREVALNDLKMRLGVGGGHPTERQILVIQGWPGIGKTTLTAALAHDVVVQHHFIDGILWTSLGQSPEPLAVLLKWGNALQVEGIQRATTAAEASLILTNAIRDKQILVIVDDVWDEGHFTPFKIGGRRSATLVTTRLNRVAQSLISRQDELYKIPLLDDDRALELLQTLAPDAVATYPDEARELVQDLEGLPLALQVAGRLLREEYLLGWGTDDLLKELREGRRLLEARAPADRQQSEDDVPMTIAALLKLSTDSLDETTRRQFALLGVFAPKPAVFDLEAMEAVWAVEDGRPAVRRLVERGLLESIPLRQFQMHALLVQHARTMFEGTTDVPES